MSIIALRAQPFAIMRLIRMFTFEGPFEVALVREFLGVVALRAQAVVLAVSVLAGSSAVLLSINATITRSAHPLRLMRLVSMHTVVRSHIILFPDDFFVVRNFANINSTEIFLFCQSSNLAAQVLRHISEIKPGKVFCFVFYFRRLLSHKSVVIFNIWGFIRFFRIF